jgi:hypothetical protein
LALADDLEFIMVRLAKVPARRDLAWVALGAFWAARPLQLC